MIKTAFVLGAGLGTRLRPLTEVLPKPLVPVCLKPLIAYGFDHLRAHGVERFVVNTHWLPKAWTQAFPEGRYGRSSIAFRHEPEVLETAGGIKNVEDLLGGEPFIVYNGDILTDLPLAPVLAAHKAGGHEVTMVLRSSGGPLQVAFDSKSSRVTDIGGKLGAKEPCFLFTGIYVVEPAFLARIPAGEKIGVVRIFLEMIRQRAALGGIVVDDGHWWDLGTREKYLDVHRHFAAIDGAPWIAHDAEISPYAEISGASAIDSRVKIGADCRVVDSILWPGAEIEAASILENCIVTGREPVCGAYLNRDF
jgi:NDP-sugar pyrophosphorylase family protein